MTNEVEIAAYVSKPQLLQTIARIMKHTQRVLQYYNPSQQ